MSETLQELTHEERLKAVVFRFMQLYDRFSEDRLVTAKQGAEIDELIKKFEEQIKHFEAMESNVREMLSNNIKHATEDAAKTIGEEIKKTSLNSVEELTQRLSQSAKKAEQVMAYYHNEMKSWYWAGILLSLGGAIMVALLIVRFLMPTPVLPLSDNQLDIMNQGRTLAKIWDKLSKKEQTRLQKLAETENIGASNPSTQATQTSDSIAGQQDQNTDNN